MKQIYLLMIVSTMLLVTSCSTDSNFDSDGGGSSEGKGGSMARFCVVGDVLYTVDNKSLKIFNISDPQNPIFYEDRTQDLGFDIETIFPMDTLLFIGSQSGMLIYNIAKPLLPQYLSRATHITSCDPVVAQDNYAYVTLNSNNTWCGRSSNVLQIYDITNPREPEWKGDMPGFTSPMGLGIDGNKLFICDKGLKVYDITNPVSPEWIDDLYSAGLYNEIGDSYDVIPINGLLILVTSKGIYQLDYTGESLKLLSKITIER
jgi:hypothetical protein